MRISISLYEKECSIAYTQGSIVTGLQNRFKEFRRDRKVVKVEGGVTNTASKENQPPKQPRKPSSVKQCAASLVQPPAITSGEDEHSFARFNGMLKAEAKKAKPNREIVRKLMERTYSQRRIHILSTPMPLTQLLSQYPFLGRDDEVC